ncbi:MAG TPA: FtsX-like permease family protein, partial [Gemmatimonadaceae bacterium]|nr:FtsX-like permease family protein [Gemmatimonadaceae bacterium]
AGALRPAGGPGAGLESRTLRWVAGVAGIVLLIACANVTNLQLARSLRRRREFAMRRALGVRLGRLMRQSFTESLLLGLFGCAAGVVLAEWGGAVLRALLLPPGMATGVVTDWRTLTVALACALVAGIVTGVAPAILATRDELAPTLRAGARAGTYQRSALRTTLLVTQGALSVLLLIGAALFVRSLENVRSLRLGYDPEPVLIAHVNFRAREDSALRVAVLRSTLERARAIPGVEAAARANNRPFATNTELLYVPGVDSVQRLGRFVTQVVTPDYFSVVGTRLLRGRPLTEADDSRSERVMVASEAMASALWPGQDALGKCVRVGSEARPCTHVVGIAEDAAYYSLTEGPWLAYYVPVEQQGPHWGQNIVLRIGGGRATEAMERVRRELQRELPADVYVTVRGFDEYVAPQRRTWLLGATMFVAFGGLALLVAAVGLYGVIGYNVAQRMHELGIRIALGARAPHVVRLVVGQGVAFAAGGVAIGVALSLIVSAWVQPLLFRQSARDPVVYGMVAAAMVLVAVLASLFPSLRAVRADPNTALRTD